MILSSRDHEPIRANAPSFFRMAWARKWWFIIPMIAVLVLLAASTIFDFSEYLVFLLHE
jgi:hypothetical protein